MDNNKRDNEGHLHFEDSSKRSRTNNTDNNINNEERNLPFPPPLMRIVPPENFSNLLSLSLHPPPPTSSLSSPPHDSNSNTSQPPSTGRTRRVPSRAPRAGKPVNIDPPYPWATNLRAKFYTVEHMASALGIATITGEVQCKRCDREYVLSYDLLEKFREVRSFVVRNKEAMHQRAPKKWAHPALPRCTYCEQENSLKPVVAQKKRDVNWLFLFLGQMLGCCTLDQLKYFCKHTKNHRTGAKDRVLYLAYLEMCRQLEPSGTFDI